jgi:hypothetical protein
MRSPCRFGFVLGSIFCAIAPLSAQAPVDPTRPLVAPPEPSIVCGMRIFPGQRAVDGKMPRTPPAGNFTLQVRVPRVCRDMSRLPPLKDLNNLPNRLPTFLGPKR